MFAVTFPWPPSLNHATRHARGGHFKSPAAKAFRKAAIVLAHNERVRTQLATLQGPLAVRIDLYPPDRRGFDVDGKIKEVFDALQLAGVFTDDRQIRDARIVSHDADLRPGGVCEVVVGGLHDD